MFKLEKTNTVAWQKVIDSTGKSVASLNELHNGDWALNDLKTGHPLTSERFSNGSRAVTWLNKHPEILNEV